MNVITGLPRSGSTLLCNILNQNPEFHATSTSSLQEIVSVMAHKISNSMEVTSELIENKERRVNQMTKAVNSFCEVWHGDNESVIFDKSRGWSSNSILLREIYPESLMLVCIRNPIDVMASIEKQHRKTGLFDFAENQEQKTLKYKVHEAFKPDGIVGASIIGVEDLLRRKSDNVVFIDYDYFATNPKTTMLEIYKKLGKSYYDHDYMNVINTSTDEDSLYRYKFPHNGSGEVKKSNGHWSDYIGDNIAKEIIEGYQLYCEAFGYTWKQ